MTQTIAEFIKTKPVLKAWHYGSFDQGLETKKVDNDFLVVINPPKV